MTEKLTDYDPANALVDEEEIAYFLAEAHATGDTAVIAGAIEIAKRAKARAPSSPLSTDRVASL